MIIIMPPKGVYVMKTCPKCKYERTVQDDLLFPDYECPSCGIIFEKDKARQELAELEKQRENERKAKLERLKKEEERKRKEEQELLQREADEKLRQKLDDEKKQAEEATKLLQQRQQKIEQIAQENPGKIISSTETEQTYQLFDMCPFNMAQTGKSLSIVGFGETKNKWQHARCMQKYCRLWTWKTDDTGAVYGQGCSLQFLGLNKGEIEKNFLLKNRQILEGTYPPPDPNNIPDDEK